MPKSIYKKLFPILEEYLEDFHLAKSKRYTCGFLPIVWFGNIEKYFKSQLKIITISLNPSNQEFSQSQPRFDTNYKDTNGLYHTLNHYFENKPYWRWFSHYEFPLNQFDATYGYQSDKTCSNTAVHIDAYSAIATNPTWGKLKQSQRDAICRIDLSKKLMTKLEPNIILFSANEQAFEQMFPTAKLQYCYNFYKANNIKVGFIKVFQYNNAHIVSGLNNRGLPFGMSHKIMKPILESILNKVKMNYL